MEFAKIKNIEHIAAPEEYGRILELRQQAFPHLMLDSIEEADLDPKNFLCVVRKNGIVVATGRLDRGGDENTFRISRVAVDESHRESGHGSTIVQILERQALRKSKSPKINLKCLADNLRFYNELGYTKDGDAFKDEDREYYNLKKVIQSD